MRLRKKTIWRLLGLAVLLILAAGLIAPQVNAGRFLGGRVRASLEQALGRGVELGEVHLDLFNGPGFSVDGVTILEDPRVGIEPFAYVESLEARVSFASLWTGRLEFSKLRLVNPQVNLARPHSGAWNFQELLTRTAGAAPAGVQLPLIQVRGGRINFKAGDTKSIFYITEALLDATPPSSPGGEWRLRFEGQPARTDRTGYGFGTFTARGRWRPDARTGGEVDISLDLEKSGLAELIRLVHGHDIGLHGQVSSHAHLAGPVAGVQITGTMQVGDIHRWDLLPPYSDNWPLEYRGRLDLVSQTLELETAPPAGEGALPLSLRVRASGYLGAPVRGILVTLDRLPLAPLPQVGRHMGLALPRDLVLDGRLTGVLGYSAGTGLQGKLVAVETEIQMPGSPAIRLERAELVFEGERVMLPPTAFRLPVTQRQSAGAGGPRAAARADQALLVAAYSWKDQALDAAIVASSLSLPEAGSGWARLLGAIPLIQNCRQGAWKGNLNYHQEGALPGGWTGTVLVQNTQIPLPGIADPLELARARIMVRDGDATLDRIAGRVGAAEVKGEYHYRAKAARPHQFRVSVAELDAVELERLLLPALRRDESFLTRALRLGRTRVPEWLEARRTDGVLEIGSVSLGDLRLANLRAHFRWDATIFETTELTAQWGKGLISGHLVANLRRAAPSYRLTARFRSVNWMGGQWDGRGSLETSGAGPDLARNLRLESTFKGRSVALLPDTEFESVSGSCLVTVARGLPQFRFTDLQAVVGEDLYQGRGASGADGRVSFELTDGQKQLRVTGTLSPFQLNEEARPGKLD
ncbi:MAG: AsmA family protein [Bryobacteraceae bacterium]|jgi:hypothetical protein